MVKTNASSWQNVLRFRPEPIQLPFMRSTARFPAYVAGWGTGKTMTMIMKALILSTKYKNNQGMIFRKTETSLRDSTIRDFQDYTHLKVPKVDPKVKIPGTNSWILFGHADDMRSLQGKLQNINLGWAGIEQTEEMQTPAAFDMLRGRLRRILTPSREVQQKLVDLGALDGVVRDFRQVPNDPPAKKRDKAVHALIHQLKEPYHQLMVIANTNGHNWIYKRWKKKSWPEYELSEAHSFQNEAHLLKEDLDDWARLKLENPKKHARLVMNSWEDYDIEGAYYAELMSDALKAGRCEIETLHDPQVPVYTFWDLGVRASDTTAIWFVQFIDSEIWLIDYHEEYGKGMDHYSRVLDARKYSYAAHYLPPDAVVRLQGEHITTRLNIMRKLRREPVRLVDSHRVEERIATVRGIVNRCKFSDKCEAGVEALNNYKKKTDENKSTEDTPVFMSTPKHDVWSNGADAFGYMAVVYRYQKPSDDMAFSGSMDEDDMLDFYGSDIGETNLLRVG